MNETFLIAQSNDLPTPPRETADPNAMGTRTYDSQVGDHAVSVDNNGNAVFSSSIYLIFAVLVIGLVILGVVLKRAPQPRPNPPGDAEGSRAHPL